MSPNRFSHPTRRKSILSEQESFARKRRNGQKLNEEEAAFVKRAETAYERSSRMVNGDRPRFPLELLIQVVTHC